ncbi:MAG: hypothetical protein JRI23_09820 [Deltaproteobacteria bacterium]|jgi:hypothetical protein|nr:hypothetical protein [Deltaproteobacteria bacterium]MBW2531965.1 hypothetical protein [Deltaproteobacteria bacterium]
MNSTRGFSVWVALGALCTACAAGGDRPSDAYGSAERADSAGGKADGPQAGDESVLSDPPDEIVSLAPEFFDYENAFAVTGLGVGRSPAGGIFLRATDCDRVARHVNAFVALRKLVDPTFVGGAELAPAVPLATGWCEAKLDAVLTPYLAQTFWKRIDDTAVDINCWGHALRTVEAIESIVAAEADLFSHVMSSPQCRQLAATEQPSPGDIVAIRAAEARAEGTIFQEFHGAVWVTDELWITKNGAARFDISPSSWVLDMYGRVPGKPHCSERTDDGVSSGHIADCGQVVQAFRCQSLAAYAASQPDGLPLFDSLVQRVGGLLDHRVVMQQEQEDMDDIVAPGTAYVSRHPFSYVNQIYQEYGVDISPEVERYLEAATRDPRLRLAYDLDEPPLPELPGPLVSELQAHLGNDGYIWQGEGFGRFCNYFAAEHAAAFASFEQAAATMPAGDRSATIALLLQLASSDCRNVEAMGRLEPYLNGR